MNSLPENGLIHIRNVALKVCQKCTDEHAGTLVFLHDSLGCIDLWRNFPAQLARTAGMSYMIYDRVGYGDSSPFAHDRKTDYMETEADILMELLEKCNIIKPVLFGHSDGGTIALLAAAKYPDHIKAVITEGAHVFVEEITLEGIERTKEQYRTTNLKERLEKYHGYKTQALFDAWTDTWLSPEYREWNITGFLPKITCPVFVIQGAQDEFGTTAQVQSIATKVSGPSETAIVIHAGHSPHKQSELWLINRCCSFFHSYNL